MEEEYSAQELLQPPEGFRELFKSKHDKLTTISKPGFYDWMGDHRPNGVVFMHGKNILGNKRVDASIVDIVPTILSILNAPLSSDFDGQVLTDVFINPPKTRLKTKKKSLLSPKELAAIKNIKKKNNKS